MAWYSAGTIAVTNGSAAVTGANTDFVSNVFPGDALNGPDGRNYEIARVVSATELVLARAYAGATAGGQPFSVQPTQDYSRTLALRAGALVNDFSAVLDGIGQGLIGDGTVTTPAIRFRADQDTGLSRPADNALGLVAGGVTGMLVGADNVVPAGSISMNYRQAIGLLAKSDVWSIGDAQAATYGLTFGVNVGGGSPSTVLSGFQALIFGSGGQERARIDSGGNFMVGVNTGNSHRLAKPLPQGGNILAIGGSELDFAYFSAVSATGWGGAASALYIGRNSTTNRSINAGGTLNASGADYAEYMTKAAGCGTIAAGDVCGVDIDGKLTRTWADARSFVVKSTDPAYVGGDTWAAAMAPRPEQPGDEPIEPATPPAAPADDAELEAWREIVSAYPAALAGWRADHTAWEAATAAYQRNLAAWEAELETARVKVDRIAFCGQVPVNVAGEFAVGDYLIAAAAGAGIKAVAIAAGDISFDQYRRRLGKVWAIRDGRAWVDVQHG